MMINGEVSPVLWIKGHGWAQDDREGSPGLGDRLIIPLSNDSVPGFEHLAQSNNRAIAQAHSWARREGFNLRPSNRRGEYFISATLSGEARAAH